MRITNAVHSFEVLSDFRDGVVINNSLMIVDVGIDDRPDNARIWTSGPTRSVAALRDRGLSSSKGRLDGLRPLPSFSLLVLTGISDLDFLPFARLAGALRGGDGVLGRFLLLVLGPASL